MSASDASTDPTSACTETDLDPIQRGIPSAFEKLITDQPPILQSLIAQLPTQSILALFHTSSYLNDFLRTSPTSWRYISWRLYQPALTTATPTNNASGTGPRQSSNYALDQLLLYVINPYSTRLVSLELDNTAVSGATLFQTVMVLRKDTLEHVSVRGCKNVSLKYHINPWLTMHALAAERMLDGRAPGYEKLALKSLYTYRCRHHRRRPYLPSSLARKESDSEPTHELVLTCHRLGIWTDTAWCTTPGARCFRRRGYVTMRTPQDLREVWVVYDRLWRSRNWLGPVPENRSQTTPAVPVRKRKRDCRSWEFEEDAMNGESVASKGDGKATSTHLRKTHTQFIHDIYCDNCSDPILERCEQCSVMMHCSGCRKTLCASCAFDRPYLRNKMAPVEERNKFWWAPGCAVSPCSMQDQDPSPPGPVGNAPQTQANTALPSIKFRWCCTEPIFSGGGGITFGSATGQTRETDRIRAAPLPSGQGWEDPEFSHHTISGISTPIRDVFGQIGVPLTRADRVDGPAGRWPSIDSLFRRDPLTDTEKTSASVPRILCDECYQSDQWKIKCKACSVALCLRHDVRDRLKIRICGYKDLATEKAEHEARQKALKLLTMLMVNRRKNKLKAAEDKSLAVSKSATSGDSGEASTSPLQPIAEEENDVPSPSPARISELENMSDRVEMLANTGDVGNSGLDADQLNRPISPGSNSTGPPSRISSPTPSARSAPQTPEPSSKLQRSSPSDTGRPMWRGCQSFFCPSPRPNGDHRRRCIAVMRQCAECKVYVCELCSGSLEDPCRCKGCRVQSEDGQTDTSTDASLRFFCPNCRWSRMLNGKCKRKPISTPARSSGSKKKQSRPKKPPEERRGYQRTTVPGAGNATPRDTVDGLSEFFEGLQVMEEDTNVSSQPADEADTSPPVSGREIGELEDVGALARELIRRIQALRHQFGPNSLAALALPDIRMEDNGNARQHLIARIQQTAVVEVLTQVPVVYAAPTNDAQAEDDGQASSSGSGV